MASIKKLLRRVSSSGGGGNNLGRMATLVRKGKKPDKDAKEEPSPTRTSPSRRVTRRSSATVVSSPSRNSPTRRVTRRASASMMRRVRQTQKKRQSFVCEGQMTGKIKQIWELTEESNELSSEPTTGGSSGDDSIESQPQVDNNEDCVPADTTPAPPPVPVPEEEPSTRGLRWHCSVDDQLEEKRLRLMETPSRIPRRNMTKKQLIFEFPSHGQTGEDTQDIPKGSLSSTQAVSLDGKGLLMEDEDDTSRSSYDSVSTADSSDDEDSDIQSLEEIQLDEKPDDLTKQESTRTLTDEDIYLSDDDDGEEEEELEGLNVASCHTVASF